jgi:hypothetical protein
VGHTYLGGWPGECHFCRPSLRSGSLVLGTGLVLGKIGKWPTFVFEFLVSSKPSLSTLYLIHATAKVTQCSFGVWSSS